jgi:hypothetical protein
VGHQAFRAGRGTFSQSLMNFCRPMSVSG